MERVAVIGASDREDRYSYKACKMLQEHGHEVFPVSPTGLEILGRVGYRSIADVPQPIDTVTLYVNPHRLVELFDDLLTARPRRVIFNPGTESPEHQRRLEEAGIHAQVACTLVLLSTGVY